MVKPVAEIPSLTGRTTAVALDAGFVEALGTLKLTPGTVGDAELTKAGSLVFPITGGNVEVLRAAAPSPRSSRARSTTRAAGSASRAAARRSS